LWRRHGGRQGAWQFGAAQAHPERADAPDAPGGVRRRLSVRPRCPGRLLGPELLSRCHGAPALLCPGRSGFRGRASTAAGALAKAASGTLLAWGSAPRLAGLGAFAYSPLALWDGSECAEITMVAFKDLWYRHPANNSTQYPCVAPHALTNLEGSFVP